MYTFSDLAPDMTLVALGVVIWVVAISIAFGFYIPVLRAAARPTGAGHKASAAAEQTGDVQDVADMVSADLDHAPSVAKLTPTAAPATPPDAFSVLIVDDNEINRRVLEMILDSVGVAHVSVENGQEAVEAMEACPHHAVLMDLQMPVMDGFEATRRIRALQAERGDAPSSIIVVSANCLDEHVAAGRDAGANSHLAKPISAAALIGELATCSAAQMAA